MYELEETTDISYGYKESFFMIIYICSRSVHDGRATRFTAEMKDTVFTICIRTDMPEQTV